MTITETRHRLPKSGGVSPGCAVVSASLTRWLGLSGSVPGAVMLEISDLGEDSKRLHAGNRGQSKSDECSNERSN